MISRRLWCAPALFALASGLAPAARADSGPENALLIIDPGDAASMYLGNLYKALRRIPDRNVLYIAPGAVSYPDFVAGNLAAVESTLAQRAIDDRIDVIVIAPSATSGVPLATPLSDMCSPVRRLSLTSAYAGMFWSSEIARGTPGSLTINEFWRNDSLSPRTLDAQQPYLGGVPSSAPGSRRYIVAGLLGYTGPRGNTIPEIRAMIERSVLADGSRPPGVYAFVNNSNDIDRNVRVGQFYNVISAINALNIPGVRGEQFNGTLPLGRHDVLGVMTAFATADVAGGNFTLRPGTFADHLTSYACVFDLASQTKASEWIRKGASATAGAVEEPCNYRSKFPGAVLHAFALQGMALGEAYWRSSESYPFQGLFLGDPLCRPWAYVPSVSVAGLPAGPISGSFAVTPSATTPRPGGRISHVEIMVDGESLGTTAPGSPLIIDTLRLNDGWHELRAVAVEDSPVRTSGSWVGGLTVNNRGLTAHATASTTVGDRATLLTFGLSATGAEVRELRLVHNGRIVATRDSAGPVSIHGQTLGAGPITVHAEALFTDGFTARGAPLSLDIAYDSPSRPGAAPLAFSYERSVRADGPFVLELPATFADDPSSARYTLVTAPAGATVNGSGASRLIVPGPNSRGSGVLEFRVETPSGRSQTATVTMHYPCVADFNRDGFVDFFDFVAFSECFDGQVCSPGRTPDVNGDGFADVFDLDAFVSEFEAGC